MNNVHSMGEQENTTVIGRVTQIDMNDDTVFENIIVKILAVALPGCL